MGHGRPAPHFQSRRLFRSGLPCMSRTRKLSYRSDLSELERIEQDVAVYCREHGIDPDTALALTLCLDELFTNTVRHGYGQRWGEAAGDEEDSCVKAAPDGSCDPQRRIEILLEHLGDSVRVRYCDDGHPFDPFSDAPPPPRLEVEPEHLPTGGFGIQLLRKLCSDYRYEREGDRNRIDLAFIWR